MEEEGVVGGGEEGERGVVPVKTLAGSEDPAPLSLALDSNGGYYTLGPPSPHTLLHTLSLTLHTTNNMPTPPSPHSQWYFYYRLLGNEIISEPFAPPTFQTERASIRILCSRESLGVLLASQEDITLHLCAGGQSCCHGNLPLRALSSSDSLTETVELRGGQTPPPTVDVTLQLESSHPTPSPSTTHAPGGKIHMQLPPSEPRPPAPPSPSPSPPPPPTHPPESLNPTRPTGLQQHNPLPSSLSPPHPPLPSSLSPPHPQEHPSPSSVVQSARRNLTRSFEEASQQTTPTRQQTTPTILKTTPTKHQTTPPSKVDFRKDLQEKHKMAPLSTVPSTAPTVPLPSSHPHPIPLTEVHTTISQATAVERQEVGVARTGAPAHHFRFSVDVRSIHNLQMGASLSCFLKYNYPFFGSPHPVLVLPPVTVSANSEQTFSQSYCTFDFATSPHHLISQLHTHPLNIEVWQSGGEGGRSHDQLVGVAKLSLSEVLTCEKVEVGGGEGGGVTRQLCSLRVPITPPHSPLTTSGYLHTILVLEDHGPIRLAGVDGRTRTTSDKLGASSQASLPVGSVEYQAALELEMWKMAEEEAFQKQLREREEAHMSRLAQEWQQREDQRQTIVKQKLERYSELECQLQTTLRDVQMQQTQFRQREAQVIGSLKRALQPSVTDLQVEFHLPEGYEVAQAPQKLPPIFSGDKLVTYGTVKIKIPPHSPITGRAALKGSIAGQPLEFSVPFQIPLSGSHPPIPILHHLAAKRLLQDWQRGEGLEGLDEEERERAIVKLSSQAQVLSAYTAFVAIDRAQDKPIEGAVKTWDISALRSDSPMWRGGLPHGMMMAAQSGPAGPSGVKMGVRNFVKTARAQYHFAEAASRVRLDSHLLRDEHEEAGVFPDDDDGCPLHTLISLQLADGSWDLSTALATALGRSLDDLEDSCPERESMPRVWATVLSLVFLEEKCQSLWSEWELVAGKGGQWLQRQTLPATVSVASLKVTARKWMVHE